MNSPSTRGGRFANVQRRHSRIENLIPRVWIWSMRQSLITQSRVCCVPIKSQLFHWNPGSFLPEEILTGDDGNRKPCSSCSAQFPHCSVALTTRFHIAAPASAHTTQSNASTFEQTLFLLLVIQENLLTLGGHTHWLCPKTALYRHLFL